MHLDPVQTGRLPTLSSGILGEWRQFQGPGLGGRPEAQSFPQAKAPVFPVLYPRLTLYPLPSDGSGRKERMRGGGAGRGGGEGGEMSQEK